MPGLTRALCLASLMKATNLGIPSAQAITRASTSKPGLVSQALACLNRSEIAAVARQSHLLSAARRSSQLAGRSHHFQRLQSALDKEGCGLVSGDLRTDAQEEASAQGSDWENAAQLEPCSSAELLASDQVPEAEEDSTADFTGRTEGEASEAKDAGFGKKETEAQKAKANSPERRRRGPLPDLMTVKGIGPRNMEKLVAKGIGKLVELKQLYRDKFRTGGTEKLVEYLVASVGVQKNHANVIASFIKEAVDKELITENIELPKPKRLTFCVEGNISVGKTTFLQRIANETIELRDLVEVVPEPIGKWQDVGKDHFNVLDAFYAEPQRYAYTFQNYVFVTRLMQERESANGLKPLRLMERSVFSDRMVFVRAVHEAKWMSEMEISIYDSWFDPVVTELPGLIPDGFIYLRASPDACHRRLQMRKRPEEQKVTLDYLQGLHEKHEQWLFPTTKGTGSVMCLKEWEPSLFQPPSRIKDRVFYLEGDHVHSSIRKVPALILDCEASIDFSKDVEAKAEYARQVADFFEYVKQTRSVDHGPVEKNIFLPKILGPDGFVFHH